MRGRSFASIVAAAFVAVLLLFAVAGRAEVVRGASGEVASAGHDDDILIVLASAFGVRLEPG